VPAEQLAADDLVPHRDIELEVQRLHREAGVLDLSVEGHHHRDMVPQARQIDGKRPANVRETAGFGKRSNFAGGEQDVQGSLKVTSNSSHSLYLAKLVYSSRFPPEPPAAGVRNERAERNSDTSGRAGCASAVG